MKFDDMAIENTLSICNGEKCSYKAFYGGEPAKCLREFEL